MTSNRRDVLRAAGVAGLAGALAGCLGGGGGQAETTESTTTTESPDTTATTDAAAGTTTEGSMDGPTVTVSDHPEYGEILADGDGMVLYLFTPDSDGESTCYDSCADTWPPLTVEGEPTPPADGLPMALETTERDDDSTQVVYDGWPLYYFASDSEPGDATGQGVNDVWFVVHPEGNDSPGGTTTDDGGTTTASDGSGGGDETTDDGGYDY